MSQGSKVLIWESPWWRNIDDFWISRCLVKFLRLKYTPWVYLSLQICTHGVYSDHKNFPRHRKIQKSGCTVPTRCTLADFITHFYGKDREIWNTLWNRNIFMVQGNWFFLQSFCTILLILSAALNALSLIYMFWTYILSASSTHK